jgi:hypothetical protein
MRKIIYGVLATLPSLSFAADLFEITALPLHEEHPFDDTYVMDINDNGSIVGWVQDGAVTIPLYWATPTSQPVKPTRTTSGRFLAINNSGVIAGNTGYNNSTNRAAYWQNITANPVELGSKSSITGTARFAFELNDSGHIVYYHEPGTLGGLSFRTYNALSNRIHSIEHPSVLHKSYPLAYMQDDNNNYRIVSMEFGGSSLEETIIEQLPSEAVVGHSVLGGILSPRRGPVSSGGNLSVYNAQFDECLLKEAGFGEVGDWSSTILGFGCMDASSGYPVVGVFKVSQNGLSDNHAGILYGEDEVYTLRELAINIQPNEMELVSTAAINAHKQIIGNAERFGQSVPYIATALEVIHDPGEILSKGEDQNADGNSDILWHNGTTGANHAYIMDGPSIEQGLAINPSTSGFTAYRGDFDGDGVGDIMWRHNSTAELYLWLMDGVTRKSVHKLAQTAPHDWNLHVGDLNGDGKDDLVWRNFQTGQNWVYFMSGGTITSSQGINETEDLSWHIKGIADMNGDNKDDILFQHAHTGVIYAYFMNGATPTYSKLNTSPDWNAVAVADFDRNNEADILYHHKETGDLYIQFMVNGKVNSGRTVGNLPHGLGWELGQVADFDGDGDADVFLRNIDNGNNWMYTFENGTMVGSQFVNFAALDWELFK